MLYVIRHGETDVNKEGRVQGRNGLPLNNSGFQQAESLKEKIDGIQFNYIFSSPQERAVQTAEIATGMQACNDERLNVFDLGTADGLKKKMSDWQAAFLIQPFTSMLKMSLSMSQESLGL